MILATHFFLYTLLAVAWLSFCYWTWIVFDSVRLRAYLDTAIASTFVITIGALLSLYYLGDERLSMVFRLFLVILLALPIAKNVIRRRQAKRILRDM